MKKGISISLVLLMLTAMSHINVATHFCGGKFAASKISLSGKLASCGMEGSEKKSPLSGSDFTTHCCNDVVTFCGTDSNYESSFSFLSESHLDNFKVFALPLGLSVNSYKDLIPIYTNVSPPGELMSNNVDLSDICVLRI
jgi:hypothetical protein